MLRSVLAAALVLAASTAGANPLYGFLEHQAPQPPVGGDCNAVAAAVGPDAAWYGEFAGNRYDPPSDQYLPYSARGCFESEISCRIWQNVALTYIGQGNIIYTRCSRGL